MIHFDFIVNWTLCTLLSGLMTLLIQLVRWSQNSPALGESSDNVKSKRQFSQERCELEISHTGQTVRKYQNGGTRTLSG